MTSSIPPEDQHLLTNATRVPPHLRDEFEGLVARLERSTGGARMTSIDQMAQLLIDHPHLSDHMRQVFERLNEETRSDIDRLIQKRRGARQKAESSTRKKKMKRRTFKERWKERMRRLKEGIPGLVTPQYFSSKGLSKERFCERFVGLSALDDTPGPEGRYVKEPWSVMPEVSIQIEKDPSKHHFTYSGKAEVLLRGSNEALFEMIGQVVSLHPEKLLELGFTFFGFRQQEVPYLGQFGRTPEEQERAPSGWYVRPAQDGFPALSAVYTHSLALNRVFIETRMDTPPNLDAVSDEKEKGILERLKTLLGKLEDGRYTIKKSEGAEAIGLVLHPRRDVMRDYISLLAAGGVGLRPGEGNEFYSQFESSEDLDTVRVRVIGQTDDELVIDVFFCSALDIPSYEDEADFTAWEEIHESFVADGWAVPEVLTDEDLERKYHKQDEQTGQMVTYTVVRGEPGYKVVSEAVLKNGEKVSYEDAAISDPASILLKQLRALKERASQDDNVEAFAVPTFKKRGE